MTSERNLERFHYSTGDGFARDSPLSPLKSIMGAKNGMTFFLCNVEFMCKMEGLRSEAVEMSMKGANARKGCYDSV